MLYSTVYCWDCISHVVKVGVHGWIERGIRHMRRLHLLSAPQVYAGVEMVRTQRVSCELQLEPGSFACVSLRCWISCSQLLFIHRGFRKGTSGVWLLISLFTWSQQVSAPSHLCTHWMNSVAFIFSTWSPASRWVDDTPANMAEDDQIRGRIHKASWYWELLLVMKF